MEGRSGRRFPRGAVFGVAIVALGVSMTVIALAWRSNKAARPKNPTPTATTIQATNDVFLTCTNCHGDLDKVFKNGGADGLKYRHKVHFAKGVSDCSNCHSAKTHEADRINRPTMGRCFMCHGTTKQAIAPGTCSTCHPDNWPSKPQTHQAADWVSLRHSQAAKADRFECTTCHQEKFCDTCHGGVPMPHPTGWKGTPHTVAFFKVGGTTCERCHRPPASGRDFCDTCHHPQGPSSVAWKAYHPNVVKASGAYTCFRCHSPATCATCHIQGREDLSADRGNRPGVASPTASPGG